MKLVFASDSFKESLSSRMTADLLTRAAREVFDALNGEKAQHNYP
jgi:glycerate kinase